MFYSYTVDRANVQQDRFCLCFSVKELYKNSYMDLWILMDINRGGYWSNLDPIKGRMWSGTQIQILDVLKVKDLKKKVTLWLHWDHGLQNYWGQEILRVSGGLHSY